MPYTMDDMPDRIKMLPKHAQEIWIAAFNSAEEEYDDESTWNQVAWAAVKAKYEQDEDGEWHEKRSVIMNISEAWAVLRQWVEGLLPQDRKMSGWDEERALSFQRLGAQLYPLLEEHDPYTWINDLYVGDDGALFVICTSQGKLYQVPITVTDGLVSAGEWVEVAEEFQPVTRTTVIRQGDARRWVSISAVAVLNRIGVIDSRSLFDSFVEHAEKMGEYPVRMFFHQGEAFRVGQADFLAREGNVYITSGVYDADSPLAEAEMRAIEREPGYWGESIGFIPEAMRMEEVAAGVSIPVYTRGVHKEISTLPATDAAHMFTQIMEVRRMKAEVLEALKRLFGEDEEGLTAFLARVEGVERTIADEGMVTRDGATDADIAPPGEETATQLAPPGAGLVLDEAAVGAIVTALTAAEPFQVLTRGLQETREALAPLADRLTAMEQRLGVLEAGAETARTQYAQDMPGRPLPVTYRPRAPQPVVADDQPIPADNYAAKAASARTGLRTY